MAYQIFGIGGGYYPKEGWVKLKADMGGKMTEAIELFISKEDYEMLLEMRAEARTRTFEFTTFPIKTNDICCVVIPSAYLEKGISGINL